MTLEIGAPAPEVVARNQDDEEITVEFSEPTVVYFYPRDGTSGCTREAAQFHAERDSYADAGVTVYGVSTDDVDSHAEFADDQGIAFDLLADPDGSIARAFDVPVENDRAERTTFVLVDGEVHDVYEHVNPDGHARTVLMDMLDDGLVSLE